MIEVSQVLECKQLSARGVSIREISRRVGISLLIDPPVVRRILRHPNLPTEPPPVAPARPCPQMTFDFEA